MTRSIDRVTLIVTGSAEKLGLPAALQQLWPDVDFDAQLTDDLTSTEVPADSTAVGGGLVSKFEKFAQRLVDAVTVPRSRREGCAGLAVGIDDLELVNLDRGEVVVARLKAAVDQILQGRTGDRNTVATGCSFHLLVPMLEALFFGDPKALQHAAGSGASASTFPVDADFEAFAVGDDAYLEPSDEVGHGWRRPDRSRHPKRYIRFLREQAEEPPYRETHHGARALRELNWESLVDAPLRGRFVGSLLTDLAFVLGDPVGVQLPLDTSPITWTPQHDPLLRNC